MFSPFSSDTAAWQPGLRDKARLAIWCALHPVDTRRWLHFLQMHPLLREMVQTPSAFLGKIHRPYLARTLGCTERADLLIGHYSWLFNRGFGPLIRQAAKKPLTLCAFSGKSGTPYELQLSTLERDRQDGELVLRLISGGTCFYTIACIVTTAEGITTLKVGGLHGMLTTRRGTGIKPLTRDFYGCRPKELMVVLARDLGCCLGCGRTLLIGNQNRLPLVAKHVCRKSSDYDLTWKELHAAPRGDGDYELPCAAAEDALERARSISSPSSSRLSCMPTKRSLLLETIRLAVRANVMAHRTTTRYVFTAPLMSAIRENTDLNDRPRDIALPPDNALLSHKR